MKTEVRRLQQLIDAFAALLERERLATEQQLEALLEAVRVLQGDTADRRLQQLSAQLRAVRERLTLLAEMGGGDFLAKMRQSGNALAQQMTDARAARVIAALLEQEHWSLNLFCERLLDALIASTGAERGFILFYLPESTQADVLAARNFQTRNLALEEYSFSRTLLGDVLQGGLPLVVGDASADPLYARESSVINYQLKSVLVTPLLYGRRAVGAFYLENNRQPQAFDAEDAALLELVARFAVFYLHHARLLPVIVEKTDRVFLDESKAANELIGRTPQMQALQEVIGRLADSPATVLIEGESGTGKELVARALHYQSARRDRPFVAINCAAIPDQLLEAELFGHEKGAFTGAVARYTGRLERGDGGTIFLDEISELAYPLQAKLLRFLQGREFDRLGGREPVRVNVRVVAATSKDLRALIAAGTFQEALYYRLHIVPVRLPPLRERRDDIPLLMAHFFDKFSAIYNRPVRAQAEVCDFLQEYDFRGNVRELENLIHRLVALATDDTIRVGDLPAEILQVAAERVSLRQTPLYQLLETPPADLDELRRRRAAVRRRLQEQERALLLRVVAESGGNLTQAARRLKLNRVTLHKLLKPPPGG